MCTANQPSVSLLADPEGVAPLLQYSKVGNP